MIGAGLEKPEKACSGSITPSTSTATAPPNTTTAGDTRPRTRVTSTPTTTARVIQASVVT